VDEVTLFDAEMTLLEDDLSQQMDKKKVIYAGKEAKKVQGNIVNPSSTKKYQTEHLGPSS
jgi:hypothetical protein